MLTHEPGDPGLGRHVPGVIAHRDPEVPNWLDTAGRNRGSNAARFLLAESAPVPKLQAVKLADLRSELPADTPRIDAATRTAGLERRRRALYHRYHR